jgi:hypothetical protein
MVVISLSSLRAAEAIALFDGKSLQGWKANQNAAIWSVRDGCLIGENNARKSGSILWTEQHVADYAFVFETEFLFDGNIDSGIFLREENEQIQIGISRSLQRDMTGSPYIADKRGYPAEAKEVAAVLKKNAWNQLRIEVHGARYQVALNGKSVLDFTSEGKIARGPIGLQVHPGVAMKIAFRQLKLTPLSARAPQN